MTQPEETTTAWRAVVAALANDDARALYCLLQTGVSEDDSLAGIPVKKRERAIGALVRSGLVVRDALDGRLRAAAPFAGILAADPVPKTTGVDRFLRDGRIDRYPMNSDERHALLLHVAERAFRPDEELSEAQVNERLRVFTDEHVTLRRYLVDLGVLERTASGTSYALSPLRDEPLRND